MAFSGTSSASAIDAAASALAMLWRPASGSIDFGIAQRRAEHKRELSHTLLEDVCADVRLVVQPESQLAARACQPREKAGERIVRIDDRDAVDRQGLVQRALGLGDAFARYPSAQDARAQCC